MQIMISANYNFTHYFEVLRVIFWVKVAAMVATLVGVRVALESVLHSMVAPIRAAKAARC